MEKVREKELFGRIAKTTGVRKSIVDLVLKEFCTQVTDLVEEGKEVQLLRFGVFYKMNRKNPIKTLRTVEPENYKKTTSTLKFRPSKIIKKKYNQK